MIEREVFAWGVRLSVRPFTSGENQSLAIQSEVSHFKPGRGCEIRITFSAVPAVPLRIIDAQTWHEALGAIIKETRSVAAEMKAAAKPEKTEKREKPGKSAKPAKSGRPGKNR